MLLEQRLEFIDSLPSLPPIIMPRAFTEFSESKPPHDINKPTTSALPGAINAFLPGVAEQIIDDVNLCKLTMQRAADAKYPEDKDLFLWYQYYVNGLSNFGWTIQNKNMQEVTIRRVGLTIDQVALEVAKGLIGAAGANILTNLGKQSVEAVQNDPRARLVFESNSKLGTQAKFDIAPVWVDGNGQANMILNCISLDARESTRGILFWKSTKQSTTIKTGAVRTHLDNRAFSLVRNALYAKFGKSAEKFIADLPDF